MIVAVASGKGGTGKTMVSVNLARVFGEPVSLLDCDVEEPNDHLFLGGRLVSCEPVTIPVPRVDGSLCDACGECSRFCAYGAIVTLPGGPLLFPDLCHGCGGCRRVCPRQAITEAEHRIGVVEAFDSGTVDLFQGVVDVGRPMAPPIIRKVKERRGRGTHTLIDAPPGTGCPVVAALHGTDYAVLVTEPTPFGLHDLRLAVDAARLLGISFGVIVNRVGIGDGRVHEFCDEEGIEILQEIPDDRRIAEVCARGEIVVDELPEYRCLFLDLWDRLLDRGVRVEGAR